MTVAIQQNPPVNNEFKRNSLTFSLSRFDLEERANRNVIRQLEERQAEINETRESLMRGHLLEMQEAGLYDPQVLGDVIKTSLAYIVHGDETINKGEYDDLYDEVIAIAKATYPEVHHRALVFGVTRLVREAIAHLDQIPF